MALQFSEELLNAVRTGLCATTSIAQRTAEIGQSFWNNAGLRGAGQASGNAAQLWSNAASIACNRTPQDVGPYVAPPFEGGQCPGERYNLTVALFFDGVQQGQPLSFTNKIGPISIETGTIEQSGNAFAQVNDGNGDGITGLSSATQEPSVQVSNVSLTFGGVDDCGDPEAEVPPYDPGNFTTNPDVTFTDDTGTDVTISPTIVYKPVTTNSDNEFAVPFEITFEDGSSLFGDFNISTGDFNIGPGNSGGDGASGPEREKDPDEPMEEGEEIVGVRVISTVGTLSQGRLTEIASVGSAPNLYVPRLATVLFRSETSIGNGWSQPFDVQTTDAVIYSDEVAINAAVTFRPGVTGTYKLILRPTNSG